MDIEKIRRMNDEELSAKLEELYEEKANIRIQSALAPLENPMRIQHLRRTVAKIKTVQTEREAGSNND